MLLIITVLTLMITVIIEDAFILQHPHRFHYKLLYTKCSLGDAGFNLLPVNEA